MDIFGSSKINLNFSGVPNRDRMGLKGRTPEVCLAGGFVLTEYAPGLENYFEIDREIVCFKNSEEMIDKINYYLAHDEERRAIAQAGWKRACNEYTPFHMLSRVFGEIEEDVAKGERTQPQELKVPRWIRNNHSQYHFQWGRAFLEANHKGLWKDALALSLSYNPLNIGALYYYIVGLFPPFLRPPFFLLYNKLFSALEKVYMWVRHRLLCWADSIPGLRDLKRSVARRFYYA